LQHVVKASLGRYNVPKHNARGDILHGDFCGPRFHEVKELAPGLYARGRLRRCDERLSFGKIQEKFMYIWSVQEFCYMLPVSTFVRTGREGNVSKSIKVAVINEIWVEIEIEKNIVQKYRIFSKIVT
jgi:hypothetical protein